MLCQKLSRKLKLGRKFKVENCQRIALDLRSNPYPTPTTRRSWNHWGVSPGWLSWIRIIKGNVSWDVGFSESASYTSGGRGWNQGW